MRLAILLTAILAVPAAAADDPIRIDRSIPFASPAAAPEAVVNECGLQALIPDQIQASAKSLVYLEDGATRDMSGKVLSLWITEVVAQPGGKYTGKKSVALQGELRDHGRVIGTFTTRRERGSFVTWRGTCSIVRVAAEDAAKDAARWLQHPEMNAVLGLATRESARAQPVERPAARPPAEPVATPPPPSSSVGIARQGATLRQRPSRGAPAVGSIPAGAPLQPSSDLINDEGHWWYLTDPRGSGWVNEKDIEPR